MEAHIPPHALRRFDYFDSAAALLDPRDPPIGGHGGPRSEEFVALEVPGGPITVDVPNAAPHPPPSALPLCKPAYDEPRVATISESARGLFPATWCSLSLVTVFSHPVSPTVTYRGPALTPCRLRLPTASPMSPDVAHPPPLLAARRGLPVPAGAYGRCCCPFSPRVG
eukprot:1379094-Pyramimonas_sp.AAC.1